MNQSNNKGKQKRFSKKTGEYLHDGVGKGFFKPKNLLTVMGKMIQ